MKTVKRVGIYDPGFMPLGHYPGFNRYVASLLDSKDIQVVFLDIGHKMKDIYQDKIVLVNPPVFANLSEAPYTAQIFHPWSFLSVSWWGNRIGKYIWYRRIFAAMGKLDLDLVVFTSIESDVAMYFVSPPCPYVALVLYPAHLFIQKDLLAGYKRVLKPLYALYIWQWRRFLRKAAALFTASEPWIPTPELSGLDVQWLPNRPFENKNLNKAEPPQGTDILFLTIGNINAPKNHFFALNAFEKYNLPFRYIIAGLPWDDIGKKVEEAVRHTSNKNVEGIFGNLSDETYDDLIMRSEFVILTYGSIRKAASSQVLYDAFSMFTPVIGPDHELFSYYAEKYGVCLTYRDGDEASFVEVVKRAATMRKSDFFGKFEALHKDFLFSRIKQEFLSRIEECFENR